MQIYYFSRTGRSRKIAEKLALSYTTNTNEITDDENWNGALNFLKGGKMSSKKESSNASYNEPNFDDDIIVVFPIWASGFPPAVRSFINTVNKEKLILIPTSLATKLKERDGYKQIIDLIGKNIDDIPLNINS